MGTVIYSRAILYDDMSAVETGVSYDPQYRLRSDDCSYVEIRGVGDPVHVNVEHIHQLIEWLAEVRSIDLEARNSRARLVARQTTPTDADRGEVDHG